VRDAASSLLSFKKKEESVIAVLPVFYAVTKNVPVVQSKLQMAIIALPENAPSKKALMGVTPALIMILVPRVCRMENAIKRSIGTRESLESKP